MSGVGRIVEAWSESSRVAALQARRAHHRDIAGRVADVLNSSGDPRDLFPEAEEQHDGTFRVGNFHIKPSGTSWKVHDSPFSRTPPVNLAAMRPVPGKVSPGMRVGQAGWRR